MAVQIIAIKTHQPHLVGLHSIATLIKVLMFFSIYVIT